MRKIEKMMVAAVNEGRNWDSANTRVICNEKGTFVVLYDTIIFARINGKEYYSDGGYKTTTTSSRLRSLGAAYSINPKMCECKLTEQKEIVSLYYGK